MRALGTTFLRAEAGTRTANRRKPGAACSAAPGLVIFSYHMFSVSAVAARPR